MNKKYTAAIIGTGRIGFTLGFDKKREAPASHTMALLQNKNIRIIAGCDSDSQNLAQWKNYVSRFNKNVKTYSSVKEMIEGSCRGTAGLNTESCNGSSNGGRESASAAPSAIADIIVIAVNEDSHLQTALQVISAKPKLVILEKPVALNIEEGNQIVQAAAENKVPVLVNHERRFSEDYKKARLYIEENNIGKVMTINARLDSGLRVYAKSEEETGAYSLLHDGTHLVDIVMFLLEKSSGQKDVLKNMQLTSIVRDEEKPDVIRNVTAHFESELCPDVNISISGRSRYFGLELDIIGTEGRIKIGNGIFEFTKRKQSKLYTGFYSLSKDKKIQKPVRTCYFSNMVQNAVDFLDGKEDLKSTLQTGMNTLIILQHIKTILAE